MNRAGVDQSEVIKWWDILDDMLGSPYGVAISVEEALKRARECQHADAQWVVSLGCSDRALLKDALEALTDDPRAVLLTIARSVRAEFATPAGVAVAERAARMGYAPAQRVLSRKLGEVPEGLTWAEKSASQCDRGGMTRLADHLRHGWVCPADVPRAMALYRQAAELGCRQAQFALGELSYSETDWQRFLWWGRAGLRGWGTVRLANGAWEMLPQFEARQHGRTLLEIGRAFSRIGEAKLREIVRRNGRRKGEGEVLQRRVLRLYNEMLERAKAAVMCWSMASCHLGLVRDMRVLVAKMLWEEAWRWGEKGAVERQRLPSPEEQRSDGHYGFAYCVSEEDDTSEDESADNSE